MFAVLGFEVSDVGRSARAGRSTTLSDCLNHIRRAGVDEPDRVADGVHRVEFDVVGNREREGSYGQPLTVLAVSVNLAAVCKLDIAGNTWHSVGAAINVFGAESLAEHLRAHTKLLGVDREAHLVVVRRQTGGDFLECDAANTSETLSIQLPRRRAGFESLRKRAQGPESHVGVGFGQGLVPKDSRGVALNRTLNITVMSWLSSQTQVILD